MALESKTAILKSILFITMISVPMIVSIILPDERLSPSEKRWLNTWPNFSEKKSYKTYFSDISNYANDHFGYRESLIRLDNQINLAFNQSPAKKVVKGREDWLFYKIKDPLLSVNAGKKSEIRTILENRAEHVVSMQSRLAAQGIAYQHMVVPNKLNLYSEYLPRIYALTDIKASYKYFKNALNKAGAGSAVSFDLEEALRDYKLNEYDADIYFKNDSHWNQLGAYYAYRELFKHIQQQYPQIELKTKEHSFGMYYQYAGDLANYIGLGNGIKALEPQTNYPKCTDVSSVTKPKPNLSLVKCDANETKILLIGDSFSAALFPFLGESVGSLYTTPWTTKKSEILALIDEIKPDLVIDEIVERTLFIAID